MIPGTPQRFELERTSTMEWVIRDRLYADADHRSIVARIWEIDPEEVEVAGAPAFALRRYYESADAALDDLRRSTSPSTKPVDIPARRPLNGFATAG